MDRVYHKWHSPSLDRDMELLVFGHAGLPVLVFPTSCGRFYDFENRDMVGAVAGQVEAGQLQFFCVDSVDAESWYNRAVSPRWRIARHMQYERYAMDEVLPLIRHLNASKELVAIGCSFGGYHAANIALRHPEVFTGFLSMSGAFDMRPFLHGYYDQDCYYNLPLDYLRNLDDTRYLDRYRRSKFVLATGMHDFCWNSNEQLAALLRSKGVPVRLDVWDAGATHDWPWWRRMIQTYL